MVPQFLCLRSVYCKTYMAFADVSNTLPPRHPVLAPDYTLVHQVLRLSPFFIAPALHMCACRATRPSAGRDVSGPRKHVLHCTDEHLLGFGRM